MCREEGEALVPMAQPSCMVTKVKPDVTHLGILEEVVLLKPGDAQSGGRFQGSPAQRSR